MNENQRKFFTANYADISRRRIGLYAVIVIAAFGILGMITNKMIFVLIGAGVAISIPVFGRFLDYSKTDPPAMRVASKIFTLIAVIYAILVLALIVAPRLMQIIRQM